MSSLCHATWFSLAVRHSFLKELAIGKTAKYIWTWIRSAISFTAINIINNSQQRDLGWSLCHSRVELMYRSDQSFNIPPPGIRRIFLPGRGGIWLTWSSRGRAFDHYSLGVGNLIACLDFMLRVALIPRGVINHGEDKPWCIQSERCPIRGALAGKQRLPQALPCIWRYSRTIYIIFGL